MPQPYYYIEAQRLGTCYLEERLYVAYFEDTLFVNEVGENYIDSIEEPHRDHFRSLSFVPYVRKPCSPSLPSLHGFLKAWALD